MIVQRQQRRAFSLIEMLAVIIIIMIIAGISLGSLMSFRRGTQLKIAEQLIVDFIRQAQHTARSSGAPVTLRLTSLLNAEGRITSGEISGVSHQLISTEAFEDDARWQNPLNGKADGATSTAAASEHLFSAPGHAGHGLRIEASDGNTALLWPKDAASLAWDFAATDRSKRMVRKGHQSDGFYLRASVRTPPVDEVFLFNNSDNPARIDPTKECGYVPVVMVGAAEDPEIAHSLAGLMLRRHQRPFQAVDRVDAEGAHNGTLLATPLTTWEAIGWVMGEDGNAMVSSIDDSAFIAIANKAQKGKTPKPLLTTPWSDYAAFFTPADSLRAYFQSGTGSSWHDPAVDIAAPIGDGRWVELGLLFDGSELLLFVNGVPIARSSAAFQLPLEPAHDTVWVGVATLPSLGNDPYSQKTVYSGAPALLDDVSVSRLGTDRPTRLPKGVRPCFSGDKKIDANNDVWYQITALPDGRVLLNEKSTAGITTDPVANDPASKDSGARLLLLADANAPEFLDNPWAIPARHLELTIAVNGRVTSKMVSK